MNRPVDTHKDIIKKYLGRLAYLSKIENEELERAYDAVKLIQTGCYHRFEEVKFFTNIIKQCVHCDKEFKGDKDRFY
jgi:hypothetical protein